MYNSQHTAVLWKFERSGSEFEIQAFVLVFARIFKKPKDLIYIFGYADSMKNVNLKLFEPTVELRSGQSLRLESKSEFWN